MGEDTNERLGHEYATAFRDRDEAWRDASIAPEFVRDNPGLPFEVRGPAGIHMLGQFFHGAFEMNSAAGQAPRASWRVRQGNALALCAHQ